MKTTVNLAQELVAEVSFSFPYKSNFWVAKVVLSNRKLPEITQAVIHFTLNTKDDQFTARLIDSECPEDGLVGAPKKQVVEFAKDFALKELQTRWDNLCACYDKLQLLHAQFESEGMYTYESKIESKSGENLKKWVEKQLGDAKSHYPLSEPVSPYALKYKVATACHGFPAFHVYITAQAHYMLPDEVLTKHKVEVKLGVTFNPDTREFVAEGKIPMKAFISRILKEHVWTWNSHNHYR